MINNIVSVSISISISISSSVNNSSVDIKSTNSIISMTIISNITILHKLIQ
jgi:hypothetical protein